MYEYRNAQGFKIYSYSTAETAKEIRKALKAAFAGVKFSVRSSVYSMGSSIHITWTDPSLDRAAVEEISKKFEGATFDGMTDCKINKGPHIYEGKLVTWGADFVFADLDWRVRYEEVVA